MYFIGIGIYQEKNKEKVKFLQKYYHKGVFYMDDTSKTEDDVRNRSYLEPTLEDRIDKEKLPEILRVSLLFSQLFRSTN